jgi:MerR family transcriptional regulator, light-induced transcriptional regulator
MGGMSIGDVVARTEVPEATLRMWERRHGFPRPHRTPSGHRRYSHEQVEGVQRVVAARAAGLSLRAAIERAQEPQPSSSRSLFATLRRRRPELQPRLLGKPILLAFSHAIEDELMARADRGMLFGGFQRERFYRQAQGRWRELASGAAHAVVFADFARARAPRARPQEIPVDQSHPLAREWVLVYVAPDAAVCLAAREAPASSVSAPSGRRMFETVWSVEAEVVREAAEICAEAAGRAGTLEHLGGTTPREQLRLATNIINRALSAVMLPG